MAIVIDGNQFQLTAVENNYQAVATAIGYQQQLLTQARLDNMPLSQLADILHCDVSSLNIARVDGSNNSNSITANQLTSLLATVTTFEILPLYLNNLIVLVIEYEQLLDLQACRYRRGLTVSPPTIRQYGSITDQTVKLLLCYHSVTNRLFIINNDSDGPDTAEELLLHYATIKCL